MSTHAWEIHRGMNGRVGDCWPTHRAKRRRAHRRRRVVHVYVQYMRPERMRAW